MSWNAALAWLVDQAALQRPHVYTRHLTSVELKAAPCGRLHVHMTDCAIHLPAANMARTCGKQCRVPGECGWAHLRGQRWGDAAARMQALATQAGLGASTKLLTLSSGSCI